MDYKTQGSGEGSISNLMKIVSQLRDPKQGCQWDIEQTHTTLIPYVLEEAHEVADAIRNHNDKNLIEELGDLLLQIILHSQIASEENRFCLNDVVKEITTKLIRRHPHIFTKQKIMSREEINSQWEKIKLLEKPLNASKSPITDRLKTKSRSQPSIDGAMLISKKAAKLGFEWEKIDQIWEKFDEEINELKHELKIGNIRNAQTELGDVLFTLINIARWYKLNPNEGLAETNKKFLERFSYMESIIGDDFSNKSIETLETLWQEAKKNITKNQKSNKIDR